MAEKNSNQSPFLQLRDRVLVLLRRFEAEHQRSPTTVWFPAGAENDLLTADAATIGGTKAGILMTDGARAAFPNFLGKKVVWGAEALALGIEGGPIMGEAPPTFARQPAASTQRSPVGSVRLGSRSKR